MSVKHILFFFPYRNYFLQEKILIYLGGGGGGETQTKNKTTTNRRKKKKNTCLVKKCKFPCHAVKPSWCLMPVAVYLSPLFSLLSRGAAVPCSAQGWHAAPSSSAGALPAAEPRLLAHCRGRDSASPTPQQRCGSCFRSAPTDCTARISHPSLVVWALTLEKGDWGFGSHLVLEMLGLAAPEGTPADAVGASPAFSMWSRRRQLKSCWDKGSNEGVCFGCICSRVLERNPGCWSLLQLLKHFTWKSYWITSPSRNSPWSWDQNSWEGPRARLLHKTTVGKGERGACCLMLLLLLSHPTGTPVVHALHTQKPGSATKSFFPVCFTVLFWGYFCEFGYFWIQGTPVLGSSIPRSPLRGPNPILAQEALGSDFPRSSSGAEPATGCFCSHVVKKAGEMIHQIINPATDSRV